MNEILVLDNYDSFTYNLVHLVEKISGTKPNVFLNDEIDLSEVNKYEKIILSPGPGLANDAGIMLQLIKKYASTKNILGVCLGHQAIAQAFGATLINLPTVFHGVATDCFKLHNEANLFKHIPQKFSIARYHSWAVSNENFPDELKILAKDNNGIIMALQHKWYKVTGVQFHPESILTPLGETILRNWLMD
ncbi:MAG: aminodeoxychorismate/anthranilate synthase component II [Chitinophagaceae bacterium]|nr:aminodeoxychorismate/anthranilate synthase component II [Chitinophagaceae bacterium]